MRALHVRAALVLVLALLLPLDLLHAQTLTGRVIGADGKPVKDQAVLLHRVQGNSGATIAQATTEADGRFTIKSDSVSTPDAVFFLATRWEGELYIGEAFRAPFATAEQVLQVGVPGTSASALLGDGTQGGPRAPAATMPPGSTGGAPATGSKWLLFAVPAIALLGVAAYFALRSRVAISPRRRLLRQIAELDLEQGSAPDAAYHVRRAELLEELRDAAT